MLNGNSELSIRSPDQSLSRLDNTSPSSVRVGGARFQSPAPSIQDDTLRYIKNKTGDRRESVGSYVDSSRKMLQLNIRILNKQHEVVKLRDMI